MSALWRQEEHEPLSSRRWDPVWARCAIEEIAADALGARHDDLWPPHPLDDPVAADEQLTVYLGAAGMIWGLWRLGHEDDAERAIALTLARYRALCAKGAAEHPPSLLVGEAGILIVAAALGAACADARRVAALVRENREHPSRELLYGAVGTALAARACGLEEEWTASARSLWAVRDPQSGVWEQDWGGARSRYLGAGHGFATTIQALRGALDEELLRGEVVRVLERTALREDGLAGWMPQEGDPAEVARVQWCHGAPGILTSLAELMPRELTVAAGELVWRAGPLRKGSGLCHGTAGNGFALLKLHEVTGEEVWLDRARRFAVHAAEQVVTARQGFRRGRYSLWTGDLGVAIFLRACLEVDPRFPMLDGWRGPADAGQLSTGGDAVGSLG